MNLNNYNDATVAWASQLAQPQINNGMHVYQDMYQYADAQDHKSIYSDGFAGSEDLHGMTLVPGVPSLKRYASTYDDPYSDVVSTFDMPAQPGEAEIDAPSIDRDNKLLSFSAPRYDFTLLDYTGVPTTMTLSAQLHGMFFLAESPFPVAGDAQPPPTELTCYRRNLFQIIGGIIMPRNLRYIVTSEGEQIPIMSQELVVSASESLENNPVKIISVPWKTPANPSGSVIEDKLEKEPSPLPLDSSNTQDADSQYASFPFSWKRLQFRIATANNGRRKELQQHFVVRLRVVATLPTGGKVTICEVQSGAIIVRGRSPRNFQSRKDLPLNGSGIHGRKGRASGEASRKHGMEAPTSVPVQSECQSTVAAQPYAESEVQINVEGIDDWQSQIQPRHVDTSQVGLLDNTAGVVYPASSPNKIQILKSPMAPPAPISLKLVEDETLKTATTSQTPPDPRSAKRIQISPRPPSFSLNTLNSPDESADLLYEYFPLSLSDWSEPVDAVYRPHVVHHIRTKLPSDAMYGSRNVRSKRMYVE